MKEQNLYYAEISVKNCGKTVYYMAAKSLREALDIAEQYVKENPKLYFGVNFVKKMDYTILMPNTVTS